VGLLKIVAWAGAALAGVAGLVLSEAWLVALVAALGALRAFLVLSVGCAAVSVLIVYAFETREAQRGASQAIARVRAWIARKQGAVERRAAALAHLSAFLALVVLSVTVGPFLTAIAIGIRGHARSEAYGLAIVSSVLFSATWVVVYSGGLAVIRHALAR
jgi:hypothetical protein